MNAERLTNMFKDFNPEDVERIFGREFVLDPPDPAVKLAPIKQGCTYHRGISAEG